MSQLNINGVQVKFPFEPYNVQKHYMKTVIASLKSKKNAILESPTGMLSSLRLNIYQTYSFGKE